MGFGGYCDLERTLRFQFTGEHEWNGEAHSLRPDPYGRWIVGANYLTAVPGFEDSERVAQGRVPTEGLDAVVQALTDACRERSSREDARVRKDD